MKLKYMIRRRQMKETLRNNAGRIATVAAALVGVFVGIHRWRAMRAN